MNRLSIAAAGVAVLLALSACSSSSKSSNSTGGTSAGGADTSAAVPASGPTITIKGFGYSGTMTVKVGTKVKVVNEDSTAHTLTDKATHKFDTGNINGGASGTFTAPSQAGKYPFGCNYHPQMAGTLTVTP